MAAEEAPVAREDAAALPAPEPLAPVASFGDAGLDPRLLRGLDKLGFHHPTAVQACAIPRLLEGRDAIVAARTGSGKTLAYLLPALHLVLQRSPTPAAAARPWQALVLVPTTELCSQVAKVASELIAAASVPLRATALTGPARGAGAGAGGRVPPPGAVVAATPTRARVTLAAVLGAKQPPAPLLAGDGSAGGASASAAQLAATVPPLPASAREALARLCVVVLDEADLILTYGHGDDLDALARAVPRSAQRVLVSATAAPDLALLARASVADPVVLDLRDAQGALDHVLGNDAATTGEKTAARKAAAKGKGTTTASADADGADAAHGSSPSSSSPPPPPAHVSAVPGVSSTVQHSVLRLAEARTRTPSAAVSERLLCLLALVRLAALKPKLLVFVNSPQSAVRARLFLAAFGIRAAAVHAELPANSRAHILEHFNRGVVDILIAADAGGGADARGLKRDGKKKEGKTKKIDANEAHEGAQGEGEEEGEGEGKRGAVKGEAIELEAPDAGGNVEDVGAPLSDSESSDPDEPEEARRRRKNRERRERAKAERRQRRAEREALEGDGSSAASGAASGAATASSSPSALSFAASLGDAAEFGVTRGVDFRGVKAVLNLEPPTTFEAYVHRAGRTGRAGAKGRVVTVIAPPLPKSGVRTATHGALLRDRGADGRAHASPAAAAAGWLEDDAAFLDGAPSAAARAAIESGAPPSLPREAVDALRYRAEDVTRGLTPAVVREARAADIAAELVASKRLEDFFERNPADLALLRHDVAARAPVAGRDAAALAHIPKYLRPAVGAAPRVLPGSEPLRALRGQRDKRLKKLKKRGSKDPLKAGAFNRSGGRHADRLDAPTDMELRAEEKGKKEAKKRAKAAGPAVVPKENVRKKSRRH